MATKDDGGPAFPAENRATEERYSGMSLREFYAGLIAAGIARGEYCALVLVGEPSDNTLSYQAIAAARIADAAFVLADELLKRGLR